MRVESLPPGHRASSPHSHSEREELVLVTVGEVRLWLGERAYLLRAGDYAALPAGNGVPHWIENRSAGPAEYLLIASDGHADVVTYARPAQQVAASEK